LPCWIFGDGLELPPPPRDEDEDEDVDVDMDVEATRRIYTRASEAAMFRAVQLCPELAAHLAAAATTATTKT